MCDAGQRRYDLCGRKPAGVGIGPARRPHPRALFGGRAPDEHAGGTIPLAAVDLLGMSPEKLDDVFRGSPAGPIPSGKGDGIAIFAPGTPFSKAAAQVVRAVAWKGKVFDAERGELRNLIGPAGASAICAKVFSGESWFCLLYTSPSPRD